MQFLNNVLTNELVSSKLSAKKSCDEVCSYQTKLVRDNISLLTVLLTSSLKKKTLQGQLDYFLF